MVFIVKKHLSVPTAMLLASSAFIGALLLFEGTVGLFPSGAVSGINESRFSFVIVILGVALMYPVLFTTLWWLFGEEAITVEQHNLVIEKTLFRTVKTFRARIEKNDSFQLALSNKPYLLRLNTFSPMRSGSLEVSNALTFAYVGILTDRLSAQELVNKLNTEDALV